MTHRYVSRMFYWIKGLTMATKTEKKKRQQAKFGAAADRVANDVDSFTRQHGDYVRDGNRGALNRGGTPLARWRTANLLNENQDAAIDYCIKLWERAGRHNGLVQDLLKVVGQQPSSGWAQQEALDELAWFKARIPRKYWDVFENVCRFDEPAGIAGSSLATSTRAGQEAARICVCFVADLIATWKRM